VPARSRYEIRILRTPVSTDPDLPASAIREDPRFPVVDNMMLVYYGIPDTSAKRDAVIAQIERSERGLAVEGRMVVPIYPDGFLTRAKLFDGGNYHNGDVWTWFSNLYAIALFRFGFPREAEHILEAQARVAVRDGGFAEYYEDDATGAAKGAFHYGPTAATFESAVVEGVYGIEADARTRELQVHPSLFQSGALRARLAGQPAAIRLDVDPARGEMDLGVHVAGRWHGDFRLLIPEALHADGSWTVVEQQGGRDQPVPCRTEQTGEADYLVFASEVTPGGGEFRMTKSRDAGILGKNIRPPGR